MFIHSRKTAVDSDWSVKHLVSCGRHRNTWYYNVGDMCFGTGIGVCV